jgi:hypothetical protein
MRSFWSLRQRLFISEGEVFYFWGRGAWTLRHRFLISEGEVLSVVAEVLSLLSLCFNWAPRYEDVLGSEGIAPRILNLGTRWRWVVSLTLPPLYPQGKSPWCPLDRRLCWPQSHFFPPNVQPESYLPRASPLPAHFSLYTIRDIKMGNIEYARRNMAYVFTKMCLKDFVSRLKVETMDKWQF